MQIFSQVELSETEEALLFEIYNNPVVQKHLRIMAMEDTKELLALSALQKTDSELAKAHATVNGKLAVIQTLLSIADLKPQEGESK